MVRDKNTIRGYWIYEAVTEPAFRVPWIGKVKVPEGVGYDYQARIHGMAEYDGRMYLTDWYNKSVQVFTPSKMEIVFGEETHITSDARTACLRRRITDVGTEEWENTAL